MQKLGALFVLAAYCIVIFALLCLYWVFGLLYVLKYASFRGEAARLVEMYLVPEVLCSIAALWTYNSVIQKVTRSNFGRRASATILAIYSFGLPLLMLPIVFVGGCILFRACL
jgi:hypothetical protein